MGGSDRREAKKKRGRGGCLVVVGGILRRWRKREGRGE